MSGIRTTRPPSDGKQCNGGSVHRPTGQVIASRERPELVRVEALRLDHPAVVEAGQALQRPLR